MEERTAVSPPLPWPPRRVALATLIVAGIATAFWILIRFRMVFFSLFIAIVLSTTITPLVSRIERKGIPRSISLLLVALLTVTLIIVFIMLVAPLIFEQWARISSLLGEWYQELRQVLIHSPSLLVRRITSSLPLFLPLSLPSPSPDTPAGERTSQFIEQGLLLGGMLVRSLVTIIGVGLLIAFWILESERNTRFLLLAVPLRYRESTRVFMEDAGKKVGAYTRGLVILSLIVGGMAMVAYLIIGLPNVLLLSILAGVMEAVPLVGPLLGAIPALAVAVSHDPQKVVWVVVATVIIQALENNLIVPRVMDRTVGVNPVASLLAFLTFGSIFGFTGAMLAIPLAAVIQLILQQVLFRKNVTEQEPPAGRDRVSLLRLEAQKLIQDVRKQVRNKDTELEANADLLEDTMESIVQDLDSILAQAEQTNGKQPS